jgi:hypothetical protein
VRLKAVANDIGVKKKKSQSRVNATLTRPILLIAMFVSAATPPCHRALPTTQRHGVRRFDNKRRNRRSECPQR